MTLVSVAGCTCAYCESIRTGELERLRAIEKAALDYVEWSSAEDPDWEGPDPYDRLLASLSADSNTDSEPSS